MNRTDTNKKEVRPLGLFALVMGIIYSIPLILLITTRNQAFLVAGLGFLPLALLSFAAAKTNFWKSPATNVRIAYMGHMCFSIVCDDRTVIIDPYKDGSVPGLKPVKGKADMVLNTNGEPGFTGGVKVRKPRKNFPFTVREFETEDGKGRIVMLDNGDHRVVHLGALNCGLTEEQLDTFRGADVLMVPVGGKYTLDEEAAAALTLEICPEYVIPMHFKAATYGLDDIGSGAMFASNVRNGWLNGKDTEDRNCPITVRLAARRGKEKGLSSVEVRNPEQDR